MCSFLFLKSMHLTLEYCNAELKNHCNEVTQRRVTECLSIMNVFKFKLILKTIKATSK